MLAIEDLELAKLWERLDVDVRERLWKEKAGGLLPNNHEYYARRPWNEFGQDRKERLAPWVQLETDAASGFNRQK